MCSVCLQFLEDFLDTAFPKGVPLSDLLRRKSLKRLVPTLAPWFLHLQSRIPREDYRIAAETASRIARRGRGALEYDMLLKTSMCNLLKHKNPWIQHEIDLMKVLLVEGSLFQGMDMGMRFTFAQTYLVYMIPHVYGILLDLHTCHEAPTRVAPQEAPIRFYEEDEDTLYDRDDDYQREILMEVD